MCLEYSQDMYGQNRDNGEVSGNCYFRFFLLGPCVQAGALWCLPGCWISQLSVYEGVLPMGSQGGMVEVENVGKVLVTHGFNPIRKLHAMSSTLAETPILMSGTKTTEWKISDLGAQNTSCIILTGNRSGSMMVIWV